MSGGDRALAHAIRGASMRLSRCTASPAVVVSGRVDRSGAYTTIATQPCAETARTGSHHDQHLWDELQLPVSGWFLPRRVFPARSQRCASPRGACWALFSKECRAAVSGACRRCHEVAGAADSLAGHVEGRKRAEWFVATVCFQEKSARRRPTPARMPVRDKAFCYGSVSSEGELVSARPRPTPGRLSRHPVPAVGNHTLR